RIKMSASDEESDVVHVIESDEDDQNNDVEMDEGDEEDEEDEEDDDDGYIRISGYMDKDGQANENKLMKLRAKVDWEDEDARMKFFWSFWHLIDDWEGSVPDFRCIFSPVEMDWILAQDMKNADKNDGRTPIIDFALMSGWKDEGDYDDDNETLLRRSTPLHQAARVNFFPDLPELVDNLFRTYILWGENYVDETGLTHLHVAAKYGCSDAVEGFFTFSSGEPDCVWRETGETPLHLALAASHKYIALQLLSHGADPCLADSKGMTPLHIICEENDDDEMAETFFKDCDRKHKTLLVDAKDNLDRTPLQLAVANFLPNTVEVLLDRGADLTSFVFPNESYFGEKFVARYVKNEDEFKLKLAAGVLAVAERLEKRGYKLDRSDALLIMKLFDKHGLFKTSANLEIEVENIEAFATEAKRLMINSSLSLYDAIQLRPEESEKHITITDYFNFAKEKILKWSPPRESREPCMIHLCEMLSRKFFRRWTLDLFLELTRHELPSECCEMIVKQLLNRDLWNICLAATEENQKDKKDVESNERERPQRQPRSVSPARNNKYTQQWCINESIRRGVSCVRRAIAFVYIYIRAQHISLYGTERVRRRSRTNAECSRPDVLFCGAPAWQ
ncbi:unnamed protein product, partial [Trichogramma brassicae]